MPRWQTQLGQWFASQVREEPVGLQGVIQSGLALGIAFGLNISNEAMGAILAFSAALLTWVTRSRVTPMSNPRARDGTRLVRSEH